MQKKIIHLRHEYKVVKDDWQQSERMPVSALFVTYENSTIFIEAEKSLGLFQISVIDKEGNVAFFTVNSLGKDVFSFSIKDIPKGEYCIELLSDIDYYYGYFEIAQ